MLILDLMLISYANLRFDAVGDGTCKELDGDYPPNYSKDGSSFDECMAECVNKNIIKYRDPQKHCSRKIYQPRHYSY